MVTYTFTQNSVPDCLDTLILHSESKFLLKDNISSKIQRYFKQVGYRNCIVYYSGEKPKVNLCNFKTKKFCTNVDRDMAILDDADEVLN